MTMAFAAVAAAIFIRMLPVWRKRLAAAFAIGLLAITFLAMPAAAQTHDHGAHPASGQAGDAAGENAGQQRADPVLGTSYYACGVMGQPRNNV